MFKRLFLSMWFFSFLHGVDSQPTPPPSKVAEHCKNPLPQHHNYPYVAIDLLYWVAKQEGNNYAVTGKAITVPGTVDPNTGLNALNFSGEGNTYAPDPEAKPGFKIGVGVNLQHDKWDLLVEYSYLHSRAEGSIYSNNLNDGVLPLFVYAPNNSILSNTTYIATSGATGFVSGATSHWTFLFNNLNLDLGKSILLCCCSNLILRPHFGLEGSWQTQQFNAQYFVSSTTNTSVSLGNNKVDFHQNFWGIGPRIGFDGLWQCYKHLGVFANSAFAALWGQFKGVSKSYDTNLARSYSNLLIADQVYQPTTLSPVIQLEIGVNSDWVFADRYHFSAHVAWEAQVWFSQNQQSTSIADTNLILQGLTLGTRCDF